MLTATLITVGVVLLAMCLAERHVSKAPLSPAVVYLAVGWIFGAVMHAQTSGNPLGPRNAGVLGVVTEVALLASLFSVGLRLRVPPNMRGWRVAVLLATAGMAATVTLATLAARWLVPALDWTAALLVAAILSPTDPVLAGDVQIRSTTDRDALRVSLTAEGGLNDATAAPFALFALGCAGRVPLGSHPLLWAWQDAIWPMAGGVLLGWLFGRFLGRAVHALLRRGHGLGWDELLYLGVILLAYGLSRLTATSAFLFVFSAALGPVIANPGVLQDSSTQAERDALAERLRGFGERCGRLAEVAMVMLLGAAMAWVHWSLGTVVFALAMVLVVRPVAVLCCVPRGLLPTAQRRLVAWFGIRGVGSMYYLAYVMNAGLDDALSTRLVDATLPAVALSIAVHGVSATPLMAWYRGRRHA